MIESPENPSPPARGERTQDEIDPEAEVFAAEALESAADMLDRTREHSTSTRRRKIFHEALATLMLFAAGAATDVEARHHSHDRGRARIIVERQPRRPQPPQYYVERRTVVVERPILVPFTDRLRQHVQERETIQDQAAYDAGVAFRAGAREPIPKPPGYYTAPQQHIYANEYRAAWEEITRKVPPAQQVPTIVSPRRSLTVPPKSVAETTPLRPTLAPEASMSEQEVLGQIRVLAEQAARATIAEGRDYDDRPEAHGFSREQMRIFTTNAKARRDAFGTVYHDLVTGHYQQHRQEKPRPAQDPVVAQPPAQRPETRPAQGPAPAERPQGKGEGGGMIILK
ncbi:hypothetical protein HY416_03645 [Candidatus Kaiserbacteria bacterium]|nr:hypothetical protein [Candidatus Kaiserbacteria bacterium]